MSEPLDLVLVRELRQGVAAGLTARRQADESAGQAPMSRDHQQQLAWELIADALASEARARIQEGEEQLSLEEEDRVGQAIYDALFGALGPVLGRLLEDESITDVHAEGLVTGIEAEVADAAHALAQLFLDEGDAEGARWAAQRGLRASHGYEQLYRDQMFAADLAGNLAGVEKVMEELSRLVEDDDPYGSLHPETVAVYKQLTHANS